MSTRIHNILTERHHSGFGRPRGDLAPFTAIWSLACRGQLALGYSTLQVTKIFQSSAYVYLTRFAIFTRESLCSSNRLRTTWRFWNEPASWIVLPSITLRRLISQNRCQVIKNCFFDYGVVPADDFVSPRFWRGRSPFHVSRSAGWGGWLSFNMSLMFGNERGFSRN